MKRFKALFLAALMVLTLITPMTTVNAAEKSDDVVILFTNDVHGKTGDAETFGYANIAAYKNKMFEEYNDVFLVDAGDHVQGEAIGVLSSGLWLVDIMNKAGYDFATIGNHEFDYSMPGFEEIKKIAEYKYTSCNFTSLESGDPVVDPFEILECGDLKIALIGITTPETFSKSTPAYFKNEAGESIYSFAEGNNGQDLYDVVQATIDIVKAEGADVIVALAHLGVDPASTPWTSKDVIKNTEGIDVVIDGHSHSTVEGDTVKDASGNEVILAQTGTKFANFGKLVITQDKKLSVELVTEEEASEKDEGVLELIADIKGMYEEQLLEIAGKTNFPLYINDPETGNRLIRSQETNAGDFVADAYRFVTGADIGVVNGGGIRIDVPKGDITIGTLMSLHPFGNELCVKETTGQKIADLLEMSVKNLDENGVGENGGFQHVSGMTFDVDISIPSKVITDDQGKFVKVDGERRVSNIKVLNAETGKYEALKLKGTYTIASHDYMLKLGGDGLIMFVDDKLLMDCVMKDYQVVLTYMQDFCDGKVPKQYKDINGQGRIKITKGAVAGDTTEYVVKSGDTLARLAYTYGVTVADILAANPTIKNNMIYAGKTVVIPSVLPADAYVVVAGDTLGKIAKDFATTVDALVTLNNIVNRNLIFVGQTILTK